MLDQKRTSNKSHDNAFLISEILKQTVLESDNLKKKSDPAMANTLYLNDTAFGRVRKFKQNTMQGTHDMDALYEEFLHQSI